MVLIGDSLSDRAHRLVVRVAVNSIITFSQKQFLIWKIFKIEKYVVW